MQAHHSSLRSRLIIGLLLFAIILKSSTNSLGNIYIIQQKDTLTESSLDSFISKNQLDQKLIEI
jgi:hypothetical protein